MAAPGGQGRTYPVPIILAPTAPTAPAGSVVQDGRTSHSIMPHTCHTCSKRKVKCDKMVPSCSRCRKGGTKCLYQATQPRSRKRKVSEDVLERLVHYERILQRNGLLDMDTLADAEVVQLLPVSSTNSRPPKAGKLLTGRGTSRYVDSHIWYNLPADEIQHMSDDEEEDEASQVSLSDPLTGALLGMQQNLLRYHPSHAHAMVLWKTHITNVEPICKVLHIQSISNMVESVSQCPEKASKTEEALLFAIYHVAVFSMAEDDCTNQFKKERSTLMQHYHFAARQALVNASFLKTTQLSILQALFLFLLSTRCSYDPHTYWTLTGTAARIGQRIGLHRDGERLGLPPFEVEMRRRLFYQVFPLDSRAGQSAGTDFVSLPDTWDTRPPLNIDDDQIWPGMTETPIERNGATEMIFCLSRAYFGKALSRAGNPIKGGAIWNFLDYREADTVIRAAENEVEEKFIRYCDIVNPLHFLTIGLARSGITAMRLKIRLPKIRDQTATDSERKEVFLLAQKTLDTDAAVHGHGGISKYQWYIKPFFLWGTRDSFIFTLTTLLKRSDLLSVGEVAIAWESIANLYKSHGELFDDTQALHVALRRLALRAWDSYPPNSSAPEPAYISTLRHLQENREKRHNRGYDKAAETTSIDTSLASDPTASVSGLYNSIDLATGINLDFDVDDWIFWDRLIEDHQTQVGLEQTT
ncbi:fungal-specific transcription factor domain-containing protein [Aspergillus californicus]